MKYAVVTGSSSGIGEAITQKLLQMGYGVYGISRNISQHVHKQHYHHISADLTDQQSVVTVAKELEHKNIFILVNCAGFGVFAPHEEIDFSTINTMVQLNLTTPMILTKSVLRSLKKEGGYLININSIEALRSSKFAALYSATKAGLKAFGDALFEETRKSDLSITNINPDMTQTPFYTQLRFDVAQDENAKLLASDIAHAVEHILTMRKGAVVSEYTIRSLHFGITKKTTK